MVRPSQNSVSCGQALTMPLGIWRIFIDLHASPEPYHVETHAMNVISATYKTEALILCLSHQKGVKERTQIKLPIQDPLEIWGLGPTICQWFLHRAPPHRDSPRDHARGHQGDSHVRVLEGSHVIGAIANHNLCDGCPSASLLRWQPQN